MVPNPLEAAQGYLELGMFLEANGELELLPKQLKHRTEVLKLRLEIYRESKAWKLMEVVARELWKRHSDSPDHWNNLAFAVRRAESLQLANEILLHATKRFPEDAMTHFNLGCYSCQAGDLEEAKTRVGRAVELDAKFQKLALDDPDLEPMWETFKV
jgi:tetratricopeptide (TPR) repeat protein